MEILEPLDANDMHLVLEALVRLHDDLGSFVDDQGHDPCAKSIAEIEFYSFSEPESLETAFAIGTTLIDEAADFLMGFSRALKEDVLVFSPWMLCRGVLETCALSAWFFDIEIGARERVRRGLARRLQGSIEQKKYASSRDYQPDLKSVTSVVERIEAKASFLGFVGKWMSMPNNTELIKSELDKEAEYRFFSAVLHGHHWATIAIGYSTVQLDQGTFIQRTGYPAAFCAGARTLVEAFYIPQRRKIELFGWDGNRFENLFAEFDATLRSIGLDPVNRQF